MSLIKAAGAGEQSTGFYKHLLDQSLKFDDGDAQVLRRTPASAGNRRTWTWSAWIKFGSMSHGTGQITLFDASSSSSEQHGIVYSGQQFYVFGYTSGFTYRKMLNALHRDPSAWYHYVVAFDTTDGTAGDRIKIYVNGTLQTSFAHSTNPDQNYDTGFNNTVAHGLGGRLYDGANYFDGYIAEVNMIDGTALTAASFGETKDGIWIPKYTSGLTFGTNGFHLTFKDDVVSEGFNTVTYAGTAGKQSISGVGFEPDFVWIKNRGDSRINVLQDSVRGSFKYIHSNSTAGENTTSGNDWFRSFDGDGFTVSSATTGGSATPEWNASGNTYVGWCWEAGGTPTADNSAGAGATPTSNSVKIDGSNLGSALAGSIPATRLSANTARGFSIITYTGTGSNATVAHGLAAAPKWVIVKCTSNAIDSPAWPVWHTSLTGAGYYLDLEEADAEGDGGTAVWNNTAPSSTVFSIGTTSSCNTNGYTYVAYCWTDISGYSSFGTYDGSGSSGKSVTGLGFKPAWLMIKSSAGATTNWNIYDNTRQPSNPRDLELYADDSAAEYDSGRNVTFTDDGFDLDTVNYVNNSGVSYIYMAFADTRSAAFFKDVTSNGNHFTPVNLDYRDSVPDVPTNNFCTWNPLYNKSTYGGHTYSEGNLKVTTPSSNYGSGGTTFEIPSTGKWYAEVYISNAAGSVGIALNNFEAYIPGTSGAWYDNTDGIAYYSYNGYKYLNASSSSYGASFAAGDIIGIAVNTDDDEVTFYKNNSTQGAISKDAAGYVFDVGDGSNGAGSITVWNFGQDSSFAGNHATANSNADGNGHGSFAYAPPSGFLALCSQNLPDVEIIDGTEHFETSIWTANGSDQTISTNHDPDFLWYKTRNQAYDHYLIDALRGVGGGSYALNSNNGDAEGGGGNADNLGSGGFTINAGGSGDTAVGWTWNAGGSNTTNDASATSVGTIDSVYRANTKAGFSIIKYSGSNSAGSFAHGLSAAPEFIIIKQRTEAANWTVAATVSGWTYSSDYLFLNTTAAKATNGGSSLFTSAPSSTVVNIGGGSLTSTAGEDLIAYCFHSVEGYSKVGSFVGNGNADGPFVYTGFRPAWVMVKQSSAAGGWNIIDNKRQTFNDATGLPRLYADTAAVEEDANTMEGQADFLSNGFKLRSNHSSGNTSGATIIYLAFAESPFKFANAR